MITFLQKIWRMLPLKWRLVFWKSIGQKIRNFVDLQMIARPQPSLKHTEDYVVVVAGLFRTANGIGEGVRGTYNALLAAGLSPVAVDLSEQLALVDLETNITLSPMPKDKHGILILQLNGPETAAGLQHLGMTRGRQWYTIGYWAWELPVFPKNWDIAFPFLSEIWAISEFTAKALKQHPKAPPISVMGHAISVPEEAVSQRIKFKIEENAFVFVTLADSMSSLSRKNPFTVIAAHKQAFGDNMDVQLIVKTRNLERNLKAYDDISMAIGEAKNIRLLDVSLSEQERWELFASIDSVVSLHKSEGFGLTLAEAMALNKAVISTAWSGNMDFTRPDNSYLADFTLIPCEDSYGIYDDKAAVWAEVSVQEAVRLMTLVYQDEILRRAITAKAAMDISEQASPIMLGNQIKAKLRSS